MRCASRPVPTPHAARPVRLEERRPRRLNTEVRGLAASRESIVLCVERLDHRQLSARRRPLRIQPDAREHGRVLAPRDRGEARCRRARPPERLAVLVRVRPLGLGRHPNGRPPTTARSRPPGGPRPGARSSPASGFTTIRPGTPVAKSPRIARERSAGLAVRAQDAGLGRRAVGGEGVAATAWRRAQPTTDRHSRDRAPLPCSAGSVACCSRRR